MHDWLFSLHGPLAFPVVVASWMLGDTPSTNVAGLDTTKALSVLEDAAAFRNWLLARCVVLTSLVGIPTAIIALVMGFQGQPVVKVIAVCVVLAILPFGILPIAAWLGLLLPYHPKTIRWRWDHRRDWRWIARWGLLLLAPFVIVPALATIIVSPSLWLAREVFGSPASPTHRHPVRAGRVDDLRFGGAGRVVRPLGRRTAPNPPARTTGQLPARPKRRIIRRDGRHHFWGETMWFEA